MIAVISGLKVSGANLDIKFDISERKVAIRTYLESFMIQQVNLLQWGDSLLNMAKCFP